MNLCLESIVRGRTGMPDEAYYRDSAEKLQLATSLARLETTNNNLTEKLAEQKQAVAQMEEKLAIQFKNLANDLLEEKSRKFTDQNKANLESLLKPPRFS